MYKIVCLFVLLLVSISFSQKGMNINEIIEEFNKNEINQIVGMYTEWIDVKELVEASLIKHKVAKYDTTIIDDETNKISIDTTYTVYMIECLNHTYDIGKSKKIENKWYRKVICNKCGQEILQVKKYHYKKSK